MPFALIKSLNSTENSLLTRELVASVLRVGKFSIAVNSHNGLQSKGSEELEVFDLGKTTSIEDTREDGAKIKGSTINHCLGRSFCCLEASRDCEPY